MLTTKGIVRALLILAPVLAILIIATGQYQDLWFPVFTLFVAWLVRLLGPKE